MPGESFAARASAAWKVAAASANRPSGSFCCKIDEESVQVPPLKRFLG